MFSENSVFTHHPQTPPLSAAMASSIKDLAPVGILFLLLSATCAQLSTDYYNTSCPNLDSTVKPVVQSAITNETRMGASLLRLFFHDCFVQGCDASLLLDDTSNFTGEKTAIPNNNSLRGYDVIDTIKSAVESACPGVVSCADILAITARDAVVILGGQSWDVKFGRRDSTTANQTLAGQNIPNSSSTLSQLISKFSNVGLSTQDMVVLSGAHTIGQARCTNFRSRIYNDTNINSTFAATRQANCSSSSLSDDDNLAPLDVQTATTFDNAYYTNLINMEGLMHSDQELYNNGSTDSMVTNYSNNQTAFFDDFATSMINMGDISPLTGTNGEIRTSCRSVNSNSSQLVLIDVL